MDRADAARLGASARIACVAARERPLCPAQPLLRLPQMLGRVNLLECGSVKSSHQRAHAKVNANSDIAGRKRLQAGALELRRKHPTLAIAPNASRKQATFRQIAAAKADASDLGHPRLAPCDRSRLSEAIDAAVVDEFLLGPGKTALSPCLALVHPAPERRAHPRPGIKHGMGRKVRQPF